MTSPTGISVSTETIILYLTFPVRICPAFTCNPHSNTSNLWQCNPKSDPFHQNPKFNFSFLNYTTLRPSTCVASVTLIISNSGCYLIHIHFYILPHKLTHAVSTAPPKKHTVIQLQLIICVISEGCVFSFCYFFTLIFISPR